MAGDNIVFHPVPPEVKITVFQPDIFLYIRLFVDEKRWGFRPVKDLKSTDLDLDHSCLQIGVFHLRGSRPDDPLDLQHPLRTDVSGDSMRLGRDIRIGHHLDDPKTVSQINKSEAAMIPAAIDPSRKGHLLPDMIAPQLFTSMGFVHLVPPKNITRLFPGN